jgi:hypothetical protein
MLRAESTHGSAVGVAMKHLTPILAVLFALACDEQAEGNIDEFRSIRWAVVDDNADFIGWLSSPQPAQLPDHDDIFAAWFSDIAVTQFGIDLTGVGEWGLTVKATGLSTGAIPGTVFYTEPGCTGTPFGWVATYKTGAPIPAAHCSDVDLDILTAQGKITWRYQTESDFDTMMDDIWPTAMGQLAQSSMGKFYLIPRDQPWPEMLEARSLVTTTGCRNITPVSWCSVRLLDTDWSFPVAVPPYSLVELEDAP